jgi:hypothetical protein
VYVGHHHATTPRRFVSLIQSEHTKIVADQGVTVNVRAAGSDPGPTALRLLRFDCACGQSWYGPEAAVVSQVRQHGIDVHNMHLTPDQVLAKAEANASNVQDVEGPVQAEVFVLYRGPTGPTLTGPCGPQPWYLEVAAAEDPMVVVNTAINRAVGEPLVVHSTSWRRDRDGVILSFVAVISTDLASSMPGLPIGRADLARGGATTAPPAIATTQVAEHGLRHLAWLIRDDPVVAQRLDPGWHSILDDYVPEPFRHL